MVNIFESKIKQILRKKKKKEDKSSYIDDLISQRSHILYFSFMEGG